MELMHNGSFDYKYFFFMTSFHPKGVSPIIQSGVSRDNCMSITKFKCSEIYCKFHILMS